tara:strand:+ start:601 stop:783 length:183 start_codon:yes stop_codon:yes gene_type:complete
MKRKNVFGLCWGELLNVDSNVETGNGAVVVFFNMYTQMPEGKTKGCPRISSIAMGWQPVV